MEGDGTALLVLMSKLEGNLVTKEPPVKGRRVAAVAMIVKGKDSPSVLLIRRAEQRGDPWSGQIAFPGGKMQGGDMTAKDTAVRETREEVGFDLDVTSDFLGYGRVTTTHMRTLDVVPAVFRLKKEVKVKPDEEVDSYRWVPLGDLAAPQSKSEYVMQAQGGPMAFPALKLGDYVVWGLTHSIITSLLAGA